MNCAIHTDVPAAAYCRTCGKPLCASCKHDVRGVIYCEDCLANVMHGAMPAAAGSTVVPGPTPVVVAADNSPSPGLAAILGFIPGVGAMYNGQFVKGLVHVGIFATLVYGADHAGSADVFFGFGIAFWIFYMVFDAYKTALAHRMGTQPPDPFGLERLWGPSTPLPPAAAGGEGQPAAAGAVVDHARPPIGAIIMIALGVMFLLNTLEVFQWNWIGKFWPVFLIVIGVWTWMKRRPMAGE